MKKLIILSTIILMMLTACGQANKPDIEAESQAVNTPAAEASHTPSPKATPSPKPTPEATKAVEPVNEGAVSPIAQPISPLSAPKTEIGGNMDNLSLSSNQEKMLTKATEMLLELLGDDLKADEVSMANIESREWSDASLGCPKPGMMYAQVLTSGYIIVLEVGGSQYEFHTDMKNQGVLCTIDGQDALKVLEK